MKGIEWQENPLNCKKLSDYELDRYMIPDAFDLGDSRG